MAEVVGATLPVAVAVFFLEVGSSTPSRVLGSRRLKVVAIRAMHHVLVVWTAKVASQPCSIQVRLLQITEAALHARLSTVAMVAVAAHRQ